MSKKPLIILSAGGTGGHMFPALSLHHALSKKGFETLFLTDSRGFRWLPRDEEIHVKIITASAIHPGLSGKIKSALKIGIGTLKSLIEIIHYRPKVVVGFGGYPSFPALLAAHILRIPIILHEQNAVFGRANRVVAPWTKKIALSFPETINLPNNLKNKCVVTGNPPQDRVVSLANTPYPDITKKNPFNILVVGGSQGAKIFGDVICKSIALLPEKTKSQLSIVQQCVEEDIHTVQSEYERMSIQARVEPFIQDYIDQTAKAHLIISRAGAGSVSLYANMGRPAIYVPLAISLDGDQAQNAKNMVDVGGGWILEEKALSPAALATKLETLITMPEHLKKAAKQAKTLSRLDATTKLANLIEPYL